MLYESAKMMAMPIWLSIDMAKLWRNTSGSTSIAIAIELQTSNARQFMIGAAAVFAITCSFIGSPPSSSCTVADASRFSRAHQSGRPHDQHQHHHQIRQHRRGLRDRNGQELFEKPGALARIDPEPAHDIHQRPVERNG